MDLRKKVFVVVLVVLPWLAGVKAGDFMINVPGREKQSLNGKWNVLIDPYNRGDYMKIYECKKAVTPSDLYEYSFERSMRLNVPSDWNSQKPELKYYEGTVWYERQFDVEKEGERQFLYFGAVNYRCAVYLNGELIGQHEGGFTPFQFEVTGRLKKKGNVLVVKVNNDRSVDAIPALNYDWWNYGGITRDIDLIYTPETYIKDYFVRLDGKTKRVKCTVQLDGTQVVHSTVRIELPEIDVSEYVQTNENGYAEFSFSVPNMEYWSPSSPCLYRVVLSTETDKQEELIGFRTIRIEGTRVLLNDVPIFFKGISIHEEIPQRMGRAYSQVDACMLLSEAKALGANVIRLGHYPQNEYMVRTAEKMGFLLWEEIPVWQNINFSNQETCDKAEKMMKDMIYRDKNRCAISVWGVANETYPSKARNNYVKHIVKTCKNIDPTRLYTAAFDLPRFDKSNNTYEMNDSVTDCLDFVSVNKYIGWYESWKVSPEDVYWDVRMDKPLVFSEFGGEALQGNQGDSIWVSSWTEEYQAKLYRDNLKMFENIQNLQGVFPWILFDFRSPLRLHSVNQDGWNRKGLVSERGMRKKAWYIVKEYYKTK